MINKTTIELIQDQIRELSNALTRETKTIKEAYNDAKHNLQESFEERYAATNNDLDHIKEAKTETFKMLQKYYINEIRKSHNKMKSDTAFTISNCHTLCDKLMRTIEQYEEPKE